MFPSMSDIGFRALGECLIYPFIYCFQSRTRNAMELREVKSYEIASRYVNENIRESNGDLSEIVIHKNQDKREEESDQYKYLRNLYQKVHDLNKKLYG